MERICTGELAYWYHAVIFETALWHTALPNAMQRAASLYGDAILELVAHERQADSGGHGGLGRKAERMEARDGPTCTRRKRLFGLIPDSDLAHQAKQR